MTITRISGQQKLVYWKIETAVTMLQPKLEIMEDDTNIVPEYEEYEVKFSETKIMKFEDEVNPEINGFSPQPEKNVIASEESMYEQESYNLETEAIIIKEEIDYTESSSEEDNDDPLFNCDELNNVQFDSDEVDDDQLSSKQNIVNYDNEKNVFCCDVCSKIFETESEMKRHRKWHPKSTNKKQYKCEICFRLFNDKSNRNKHVKTHNGIKTHECEECHKKFLTKNHLTSHMLIHSEERPFKCDICDATFKLNQHMIRHRSNHTSLYKCNLCHKKYGTEYALMLHTRIHTGKNNYKCEFCSRIFTYKSSLNFHSRNCTKEKPCTKREKERPFKCDLCQTNFSNLYYLSKHKKRVHTQEKPYKCCVCEKSYKDKFTAKKHIIKMHKHIDITTVIIDKFKTYFVESPPLVSMKVEPE